VAGRRDAGGSQHDADVAADRKWRLRAARRLLGLPLDPVGDDEVSEALRYIALRKLAFRQTKMRQTQPAKRAARDIADALVRGQRVGQLMPAEWRHLIEVYRYLASAIPGPPKRAEGFPTRLALQAAYWLLTDRNRPCEASLSGDWCKLAAILLGQPKTTGGLVVQARRLLTQWGAEGNDDKPQQN
jgi:hypothetical protein